MASEPRQLTLVTEAGALRRPRTTLPGAYRVRDTTGFDESALSALYHAAYPRRIVKDPQTAFTEMRRTFEGEYGILAPEASPLATLGEEIVAAVLTVREAPWPDTPPGPFIIEVIVHPAHRRLGLARHLLVVAGARVASRGSQTIGLRVMSDNAAARALYGELGFREVPR